MKKIDAYIRPEKLEDVKDILSSCNINGISIIEASGCGNQKGWKEFVRGMQVEYKFIHKIKLELVVRDDQAEDVIDKICAAAYTGEVGDGKIFVSDVLDAVRIRTKERGVSAIS